MNNAFRRLSYFSFFLFCFVAASAQNDSAKTVDSSVTAQPNNFDRFDGFYNHAMRSHFEGSLLQANYDLEFSSNMAVNNLAYRFYLQEPLKPNSILNSIDRVSLINIAGQENNTSFKYLLPLKKYNNFLFFNYRNTRHQSAKFTDDFAKFFFQGNKQFAGDSIIADDLRYLNTRYDNLQIGWMSSFTIKNRPAHLSISAGISRGLEFREIKVHKGRIFTEENGDYIDVRLDMEAKQAFYSPLQIASHSGFGALADIDFNMMLSEKSSISVAISDLGFISWDDRSSTYGRNDTTVRYDGVFVPSIDSLSSPEYTGRLGDSIVTTFQLPYKVGGFSNALPTKIKLAYTLGLTKKNYVNVRLHLMAFTYYRPQLRIESLNFFGKNFYSVTGLAFGGFGPFDVYQRVGWQINKRYYAGLGLFGIEGMLVPSKLSGFGGNINFSARL